MDTEVHLRCANRTDITSAMRENFINDAYYSIANEFAHVELESYGTGTVAIGADTVTLVDVTAFWWEVLLKNITSGKIMDRDDKWRIESGTKSSGSPQRYHYWNSTFYVDKKPTAIESIGIWYVKKPTNLNGTQSSVLNEVFDPAIVMLAASFGLAAVRDFAEANIQEVQYQNYISGKRLTKWEARKVDHRLGIQVRTE